MRVLHLDCETAPHLVMTWGLFNQNIGINQIKAPGYTLCWAACWENAKSKILFRRKSDEDFLSLLWELINEADVITTYNGNKFDLPVLNREFLENGYSPPAPSKSLDLYLTVRKKFKFASNKLDFVCQVLGLGAKVQHKGQELWTGCMEGDEKSWRVMEKYNRQDVRLLPKLYHHLRPWIDSHPNQALYLDPKEPTCTNCGSTHLQSRGLQRTNTQSYRRYQCQNCFTWLRGRHNETIGKENVLTQAK